MFTTKTFHTGELTLSYVEGPAHGAPLVLLHGVNGRWQAHEPVIQALSDRWHVYACDLRGHGESGRAPAPGAYHVGDYARDVTAFVQNVIPGDEPVVFIGISLGALVALGTGAALPGRVRGLVLVEPPLMLRGHRFQDLPIAGLLQFAYETTRAEPGFEVLVAACKAVLPDADEATIHAVATQLSKIDPDVTNPDVLDQVLDGIDLTAMPASLQCPILILHGEPALGSLLCDDDIAWVRQHARDVKVIPVREAGHDIPADIVIVHARRFLEGASSRG